MPQSKGHLNPGDPDVSFRRFNLASGLEGLVRHVWVARWNIPPGETRPQRVLTYPAFNAVFTPGNAALTGPDSRLSTTWPTNKSWVVGVLFRGGAGPLLTTTPPTDLVGGGEPLANAPTKQIADVMSAQRLNFDELELILGTWLRPITELLDERAFLVNAVCLEAERDKALLRVSDLAQRFDIGVRQIERAVRSHIGLSPKWLIECRRIQEAATALFADPDTDLTSLALDLGYTDYSHFYRQYKQVLGESPNDTRRHRNNQA